MKNKYTNRINLQFNLCIEKAQEVLNAKDMRKINNKNVFNFIIEGKDKKEIAKYYSLSDERMRQIEAFVIRKLKSNKSFSILVDKTIKIIKKTFTFDKRFITMQITFTNLFKLLKIKDFIYVENIFIDFNSFAYTISKIKKEPTSITGTFISLVENKDDFIDKHLNGAKTFIYKDLIFFDKHFYLKWYVKKNNVIDVKKQFHHFNEVLNARSIRAFSSNLERCKYLLKIGINKFIYKDQILIRHYLETTFMQIKDIIFKKHIYKFVDIIKELEKISEQKFVYLGDSLYYIIREYSSNEFNLDGGNRKIIFPKEKIVQPLEHYLEEKFPEGIGIIELEEIMKEGFSESIYINAKVIYAKNLYISKTVLDRVKRDLEAFFNVDKAIFYNSDLLEHAGKNLKFILQNSNIILKMINWFDDIVLVSKTFIKIDKNYSDDEKEALAKLLGDHVVDKYSLKGFLGLEYEVGSQLGKLLIKKPGFLREIFKYIYKNREISLMKKNAIREYFGRLIN